MPEPHPDNRTELVNCALELFVAYGYDGVGVQQIAESAGVTKPTLYHYFGSKAGLLEAVLDTSLAELYQGLKRSAVYRGELLVTLGELARTLFSFAKRHPASYRLFLLLWFAPPKSEAYQLAVRYHERHFSIFERVFVEVAKDHRHLLGRQRAVAAAFLGMLNNYISLALNGYTDLDGDWAKKAVHQFLFGIIE